MVNSITYKIHHYALLPGFCHFILHRSRYYPLRRDFRNSWLQFFS